MTTRFVARAALYAALYAALTLALAPLSYGPVQFRASEALLVFACLDPAAVVGLTLGTALGNLGSSMGLPDIVVGSLLTLVAALAMWRLGLRVVALAAPVVVNGIGVALMLTFLQGVPFWVGFAGVSFGEAGVMFTLGLLLMTAIRAGNLDSVLGALGADADRRGSAREKGTRP